MLRRPVAGPVISSDSCDEAPVRGVPQEADELNIASYIRDIPAFP